MSGPRVVDSRLAAIGLGALALFILYGSAGPWAGEVPRAEELPGISLPDIAQNLLLYVPFGVLGVWTFRRHRPARTVWLLITALALAYSAVMETLQMLLAGRIASPLDVIANAGGTAVGAAVAVPAERVLAAVIEFVRRTGLLDTGTRYLVAALLVIIVFWAWYPFDITLDISTLSERTRPVRRDPWFRPSSSELWAQGGRYALLAAATVYSVPRLARWAAPVAVGFTIATAVIVNLGQLGMGAEPIGLASLSSQSAGALAGAAAAIVALRVRGTAYASA